MNDSNSARKAVASILKRSILDTRAAVENKDYESAKLEAYHVHNLPYLLYDFSIDLLRYYWDIERPDYLNQAKKDYSKYHEEDWEIIRLYLEQAKK